MIRLHDLDELVLTVRNDVSKSYILEGINAYIGGAYRSAIISTWIAITYDIISKIREIAEQGDLEAKNEITVFENFLEQSKTDKSVIKKLQEFENELLEKALNRFEFINTTEHKYLERIKEDRNLSAHPAFIDSESLFQPSGELVRSHIVHSIKYLLSHKPIQGKAAFERIVRDVRRTSFPKDYRAVKNYLSEKYFNNSKEVLIRNLTSGFLTGLLNGDVSKDGNELNITNTLLVIHEKFPIVFESQLKKRLPKIIEEIEDESLWNFLIFLGSNQSSWNFLDEPSKIRINEFLKIKSKERSERLNKFGLIKSLDIPELNETLEELKELVNSEVEKAIEEYGSSGSYNSAFENGKTIILPLIPNFTSENVKNFIDAILNNKHDQILHAAGSEQIIEAVYDDTAYLFEKTKKYWLNILPRLEENEDKYERLIEKIKTTDNTVENDNAD
jgi:hypothetical protein